MDQYPVPKFVDRETKLLGSLTTRQVAILGVAAIIIFILHFLLSFLFFSLSIVIVSGIAIGLTFGEINGRPMSVLLFSFFEYFFKPRIYLWGKGKKTKDSAVISKPKQIETEPIVQVAKKHRPSTEEIKNLAEILNK